MIHIQNLNKTYGDSAIFESAAFTFPDRGLICILGPSGCGKSTLLNLIAGFDSDYEGTISVHGRHLSSMNADELSAYRRDNLGFIFQNYHLLSGYTVLENILLASDAVGESPAESTPKAGALLEKLGLSGKLEQKIENLSGGQKQRVAIARALLNDPSIILADEPTGALDRKNSSEIMELLKKLSESRLVIVITHDKKCAEYADEIVTIEDGLLVSTDANPDSKHNLTDNGLSVASNRNIAEFTAETAVETTVEPATLRTKSAPKISSWKRAVKNFKVHLPRYIAIAIAISLGVLCFSLSLSSGNLMEQSITEFQEKNTAFHNGYIKVDGDETELLEQLNKDGRLENIYAQYVLADVSVTTSEQTIAMPEKYPMAKAVEQMSYGVMPRRGENEIALSPSLAAQFDKNIQNLIGKSAEISYNGETYPLTISGIFNASYDDFYVSSDVEQKLYEGLSQNAYSVSYDVISFEDIVPVSQELAEQGINSQNASTEVAAFLGTFQNLSRLFFTVSVLIFAIGLFISVILLVKQQNTRFRETGLLAALGYTRRTICKILFYENIALSALSALCSALLALLAVFVGNAADFPVVFTLPQILLALALTGIIILAAGLISSLRLIHTEPAKALRM